MGELRLYFVSGSATAHAPTRAGLVPLAFDAAVLARISDAVSYRYSSLIRGGSSDPYAEANVNRIIRKVEGVLAASGAFKLPGKRAARADEGVGSSVWTPLVLVTMPPDKTKELDQAGAATKGCAASGTCSSFCFGCWHRRTRATSQLP